MVAWTAGHAAFCHPRDSFRSNALPLRFSQMMVCCKVSLGVPGARIPAQEQGVAMKFTDYDRTFLAHLARNGSAAVSHSGKESGRDFMRHPDSAWLTLTGQLGNGTANVPLRCATSSQESFHLAVKAF